MTMIVSGWSDGSPNYRTGAGYGIRMSRQDRDEYFKVEWSAVTIELDQGKSADVSLSESFWADCTELRSARIGRWMLEHKLAPWPKGNPPRIKLEAVGKRRFILTD